MRTTLTDSFRLSPPVAPIVGKPKIICNNTFRYETEDGRKVTRLHITDIVQEFPDGKLKLATGGWKTSTTKTRLQDAIGRKLNARLYSDRGIWKVSMNGQSTPFTEGMTLPDDMTNESARKLAAVKADAQNKMKLKIKNFVAKTLSSDKSIPQPSEGDCWFCAMFDREEVLGTSYNGPASATPARVRDNDHLISHIKEGYMPGSLVVNAMRAAGFTDQGIGYIAYSSRPDYNRVRRTVRRYLQKRLGLTF